MIDETTVDEIDDSIIQYSRERLGPDELLDLRDNVAMIGGTDIAARVEIERGRLLSDDDAFGPSFTGAELFTLALGLSQAHYEHARNGRSDDVDAVTELAEMLARPEDAPDYVERITEAP